MKPRLLIATICAAALALPVGALARDGASGSFQLDATFGAAYTFVGLAGCPPGTPSTTVECIRFLGTASIPGLGRVTESYTKSFDGTICPDQVTSFKNAVFEVAGKGTIEVSMQSWPACADPAATTPTGVTSLLEGTIDHGTGRFAGASGNLKLTNHVNPPSSPLSGSASDIWTGTLVVPGMEFDLTPPVLTGATSKLVKVRKKAKFARVRFAVKAQDGVDGAIPVKCKPASGSRFKVGRRKVSCVAEDTSANVATTQFTVTVRRKGGGSQ